MPATIAVAALCGGSTAQSGRPGSGNVSVHLRRGQAALKAKDVDAAAREFRAVLARDPKNVDANVNLGVIAFTRADFDAAAQYLRTALSARPNLTEAKALLGICERRRGDPQAKELLQATFPKLSDVKLRTQVGLELISAFHEQGNTENTIPIVQKLVEINPDDADILYIAQRLYRELADDTLNKLAVLAPGSARMQQVIAQRLINQGDLKGAIEHYRKALEIDPRLPGAHFELGEAVFEAAPSEAASQEEAEKEIRTAVFLEGDNPRVQCVLGRIALARSDLEAARIHYTRAISFDEGDAESELGLGRVLMSLNQPDEARKHLELATKSDPLNGSAHYRLALAYKRLQMTAQAEREMHLFEEIKKTKDQVRTLYRQMNVEPHASADEPPDPAR